jgi:nifR3 family TIM-barrel protein
MTCSLRVRKLCGILEIIMISRGFWAELPKSFTILAPMAEVTDLAFRKVIAECGRPDVFFTEFVSADGLCSRGRERLLHDLKFDASTEKPIVAQFFGANPQHIYESAKLAVELGFDGVDINMGCPAGKVVKQSAGIGLCKTPELAREIIIAAKEGAGALPVSVKTRLGILKPDLEGWVGMLMKTGIAALTIHLRTMKEMSKVPAHWEMMPEIVALASAIPVEDRPLIVGNGDILTLEDGRAKCEASGADGMMIGRGIFQNPWIFNPNIDPVSVPPRERINMLLRHTQYFEDQWGSMRQFNVLKRFYKVYINGWDGAKDLRTKLMETKNTAEVREIIAAYEA